MRTMSGGDHCVTEVTSAISRLRKQVSSSSSDIRTPSIDQASNALDNSSLTSSRLKKFSSSSILPLPRDHGMVAEPISSGHPVSIPIVGYEVMEERARFTVYKLKIENKIFGDCWFVFRRYTDFVRLYSKLKTDFPKYNLTLPRKKWFGDNFDARFIEERVAGLQKFIDAITTDQKLINNPAVRDFFCLDEPPTCSENNDESRAIFEALEETIYHLKRLLLEKEQELESQKSVVKSLQQKSLEWALIVSDKTKDCSQCNEKVFQSLAELQHALSATNPSNAPAKPSSSSCS